MLYFTGGAVNPFAACYLLLVLYASVALPQRLAWTVAVICMLGYALLHLFQVPLPVSDAASADRTLNYSAHFAIYLALAALVAGYGVRLLLAIEVLDRGPGIPPALRERIGNGLVTTKESGRGNGSGVLIACAAVERFGGTIHISDRRGGGTRVQVELPLFRPRAATRGEDDDYRRLGIA